MDRDPGPGQAGPHPGSPSKPGDADGPHPLDELFLQLFLYLFYAANGFALTLSKFSPDILVLSVFIALPYLPVILTTTMTILFGAIGSFLVLMVEFLFRRGIILK